MASDDRKGEQSEDDPVKKMLAQFKAKKRLERQSEGKSKKTNASKDESQDKVKKAEESAREPEITTKRTEEAGAKAKAFPNRKQEVIRANVVAGRAGVAARRVEEEVARLQAVVTGLQRDIEDSEAKRRDLERELTAMRGALAAAQEALTSRGDQQVITRTQTETQPALSWDDWGGELRKLEAERAGYTDELASAQVAIAILTAAFSEWQRRAIDAESQLLVPVSPRKRRKLDRTPSGRVQVVYAGQKKAGVIVFDEPAEAEQHGRDLVAALRERGIDAFSKVVRGNPSDGYMPILVVHDHAGMVAVRGKQPIALVTERGKVIHLFQ